MAWTAAALLLLSPLVAMQFTDEVVWDVADFALFGALLVGAGVIFELAVRQSHKGAYRAGVGLAIAAAFLLLWVNGGVGIIGSEDSDANLMYFGVLAVGIAGAFIGRFRAHGMARAMFAAALAQVLVGATALAAGWGSTAPIWPWDVLAMTVFFGALWIGSGLLFRTAVPEVRAGGTGLVG